MRVLVVYAHPDPESFGAALCARVTGALREAGHTVDLCDLHAEGFDPVLSRAERVGYHDAGRDLGSIAGYVDRLRTAEGLVIVAPVWNFGWPAILKGFLDRVFLPGVSFRLVDGRVVPNLTHMRALAVVTSYGGTRWRALLAGDPPRAYAMRVLRFLVGRSARCRYLALYGMNLATPARRKAFLAQVDSEMKRFAG